MSSENGFGKGIFVALGGPSGVGKSTVIRSLKNHLGERAYESITFTTRPQRKGEIDGVHYRFVKTFELARYQGDPRYVNFVSARGNWYWIDSVELIGEARKNTDGVYITAITQVHEFIERKRILPSLHWVWLSASREELSSRLKKRGDEDVEKSQAHNDLLEQQNRSGLVSLEVSTNGLELEVVATRIIRFMEQLRR